MEITSFSGFRATNTAILHTTLLHIVSENDRIKKDRNNPGVIIEMSRSLLVENLISLIKHNVITLDELNDFSEETKESIQMWLNL